MTQLRQRSRFVAGWVAFALAAQPVAVSAQDRVQLNSISRIEVKGRTIEISGSRKPSFTTFMMSDPARLVIDVSEATFADVPRELKVGDGTVTAIKTASYGSESAAIARIVIGFARELEADIATSGTALVVKLPGDPKQQQLALLQQREEDKQKKAQKEAEEKARLEAERHAREEQERLAREAAARKEQEAAAARARVEAERLAKLEAEAAEKARLKAEREEKERLAREETERRRREAEEAKKQAEAERLARLQAEKEEQERLKREKAEAERLAREEQARLAEAKRLEREAKLAAEQAEKERRAREEAERRRAEAEEKARLAREDAERRKAEAEEKARVAREKLEAAQRQAEQERLARIQADEERKERDRLAKEELRRKEEELRRREEELARVEQETKRRAAAEAKERAEAERLARAEAEARAKQQPEAERRAEADKSRRQRELEAAAANTPSPSELAAGKPARMTFVGFKQADGVGRVFFRTTAPVRYRVGEEDDRQIVLTLENTEISLPNNQRIIDASFFDTAVSLVRPEAQGSAVRVTVSLKKAVAYRASQAGNELTLEFERAE